MAYDFTYYISKDNKWLDLQNLEKEHYNYVHQLIYLPHLAIQVLEDVYVTYSIYSYIMSICKLVNKIIIPLGTTKLVELHPFTLRIYSTSLASNIINSLNYVNTFRNLKL